MPKVALLFLTALLFTSCSTFELVRALSNANPQPSDQTPPPPPPPPAPAVAAQPQGNGPPPPPGLSAADQMEWNKYAQPAGSGKSYPAGADSAGLVSTKIKGGEWAVYRTVEGGQVKGVVKMAVVGQDGDAWIYEFVSYTDKESVVLQEAVKGLDGVVQSGSADQGQVVWIKVRNKEGKVMTIGGDMLAMGGGAYKGLLTANAAHYSSKIVAGGPVTVPAGTFAATWTVDSQMAQGRNSEEGQAWVSTVVPLWHLVKAVNKAGNRVFELVAFGTSGYQSSLAP